MTGTSSQQQGVDQEDDLVRSSSSSGNKRFCESTDPFTTSTIVSDLFKTVESVKRKRGRPRSINNHTSNDNIKETTVEPSTSEEPTVRRRRGRPRTASAAVPKVLLDGDVNSSKSSSVFYSTLEDLNAMSGGLTYDAKAKKRKKRKKIKRDHTGKFLPKSKQLQQQIGDGAAGGSSSSYETVTESEEEYNRGGVYINGNNNHNNNNHNNNNHGRPAYVDNFNEESYIKHDQNLKSIEDIENDVSQFSSLNSMFKKALVIPNHMQKSRKEPLKSCLPQQVEKRVLFHSNDVASSSLFGNSVQYNMGNLSAVPAQNNVTSLSMLHLQHKTNILNRPNEGENHNQKVPLSRLSRTPAALSKLNTSYNKNMTPQRQYNSKYNIAASVLNTPAFRNIDQTGSKPNPSYSMPSDMETIRAPKSNRVDNLKRGNITYETKTDDDGNLFVKCSYCGVFKEINTAYYAKNKSRCRDCILSKMAHDRLSRNR